ncbi:alpha-amylase Aah4 [Schizosaccharomyces cryophilus OY26]|uniref:Alpha-amylase Aah4 n=1 Tax=Schizosaccharomyces cryophilus (strain OY26 / ATCC MYA-4695 / CBS 11777 / NBRC 106824 / NRRL Y48691) TaxID=653667 RepID=S9VVT5_SCHCR|nr:alpha-amylase Aah4 [Schizosaccharomyces cryophilus OY26]EPY50260.1 alpha-amylase Aah4 [Schizosaccharomyces cryophilus OY26]
MKLSLKNFGLSIGLMSGVVSPVLALGAEDWKKQSIYSVLTDRFAPSNLVPHCNIHLEKHCGGDWRGIADHLDYIQELGFTAIWISPVVQQVEIPEKSGLGEAYHGYWPKNYYRLNPHFGTEKELRELSHALHMRGMHLMVDVVINHMGPQWTNETDYSQYYPFDEAKYYHEPCPVIDDEKVSYEKCMIPCKNSSLPDINTDLISVKETLKEYIHSFVKAFKVDGIRIDSAKHLPKEFVSEFCKAAGVFCMTELWSYNPVEICDWQNSIEGLMNFPAEDAARRAFLSSNLDGIVDLADVMTDIRGLCRDPLTLGNFVESHDLSRMASVTSDPAALKNAIAFVLMGDGIPIMYYGQELALRGSVEPYNRPAFWEKGFPRRNPYYYFTSVINNFRNAMINSEDGDAFLSSQSDISIVDHRVMLLQRGDVITVVNNLGSFYIRFHYTVSSLEHKWIDIITCKTVPVEDNRQVFIIRNGDPMILYPEYKAYELGICPSPSIPTEDRFYKGINTDAATPASDSSLSFASPSPDTEDAQVSKAPEHKQSVNSIIAALFISLIMIL